MATQIPEADLSTAQAGATEDSPAEDSPAQASIPEDTAVFEVSVAKLLANPGERKEVKGKGTIGEVLTTSAVARVAEVAFTLEATNSGEVWIYGEISAEWEGECRRCLREVSGVLRVNVQEIFERQPTEGETYQLEGEELHLAAMVRENVLLNLPLAPLCDETCEGPEASDIKVATVAEAEEQQRDPRWAALDDIDLDN